MLAETCFQHGRAEEGLAAVAEAAEPMKRTHEQMWEAEFAVVCVKFSKLVMVRVRRFIQVN